VIKIDNGSLDFNMSQEIENLIILGNKKLVLPQVYYWVIEDGKIKIIKLAPFTQSFPDEKEKLEDTVQIKPRRSVPKTATKIITDHKFNGVPVVDKEGSLVGIVTEHDLISGASGIHLPTLQTVLTNLPVFSKDKAEFSKDISNVMKLVVKDVMNKDPLTLLVTATYEETVKTFQAHHAVNPIPVIDSTRKLVGVVSRYDVLKPLVQ
jgi:CBS domain-containing protein